MTPDPRLIVALDVPTIAQARELVEKLDGLVTFYKIGFGTFFEPGFDTLIDTLLARGHKIFLDAKMYDIPETVRRGIASAARRGVTIVTVHGDPDILAAAAEAAANTQLEVFAISVLTSTNDANLRAMGYDKSVPDLITLRAQAAAAAGIHGLIASAADDLAPLKKLGLKIATPGIRLPTDPPGDQKRTATPAQAIAAGADYLVIGRPITAHPDPAARAQLILADMRQPAPATPT